MTITMKFTSYSFLSLLFIGACTTSAADTTTPSSSSLRGSTAESNSSSSISNDEPKPSSIINTIRNDEQINEHRHLDDFEFTVGPTVSNGCYVDPPNQGDYCSKWNQQCLYPITGSLYNDGKIYYDDAFYSCNCVDEAYYCDTRCHGPGECYYTEPPTSPPVKGRIEPITAPPIASWCPQSHPLHSGNGQCQYPGMACDYLVNSAVENCVCENLKNAHGVWNRLWKCYDEKTGRSEVGDPSTSPNTGTNIANPAPHQPQCRTIGHGCESSSDCCDGLRCDIYVNICEENVSTGTKIVVVKGSDNHPYYGGGH